MCSLEVITALCTDNYSAFCLLFSLAIQQPVKVSNYYIQKTKIMFFTDLKNFKVWEGNHKSELSDFVAFC